MNRSDTDSKDARGAVVASTVNTRLSGFWLIIARAVWLVLVVLSLGLFVVSLPVNYQQLLRACVDATTCNITGSLSTIGFASWYAALSTILSVISIAIWCGVGFLIFWRRSNDWLALLAAFVLVMYYITSPGTPLSAGTRLSRLRFASQSRELSGASLVQCVLAALPQWTANPALDGTDLAARHHRYILRHRPFPLVAYQYE